MTKEIEQTVEDFLLSFETEEHVVTYLRNLGIKGRRKHPCKCPISNLILRKFPNARPSIEKEYVFYTEEDGRHGIFYPAPILQFTDNFDEGKYPDLIEK